MYKELGKHREERNKCMMYGTNRHTMIEWWLNHGNKRREVTYFFSINCSGARPADRIA